MAFILTNMNLEARKQVLEDHILPNVVDLSGEK